MIGESKCGPRQSTSRRRSTPSPTDQFGTLSNLATSNMTTTAFWGNYTETRKPQFWQKRKVTCLRSRKNQTGWSIIRLALQHSSAESIGKKTFRAGKRKKELEYTWATTITTAWNMRFADDVLLFASSKEQFRKCYANSGTNYLGQMVSFQQQETTEIRNRIENLHA